MFTQMKNLLGQSILILTVAALSSCGLLNKGEEAQNPSGGVPASAPTTPATTVENQTNSTAKAYKQIERLGRPAINEGLVITNAYLNAFNSIAPSLDLSPAASPVLAEAGSVLTAVFNYGTAAHLPAPQVSDVVTGFLPDVMRIDTRVTVAVGAWAYNGDATIVSGSTAGAMLTAGRKLEDDVMDITLSYLIAGNPGCGPSTACTIPDGVSYAAGTTCSGAGTGSNVGNPGHKCLNGQTARNASATFPFLARPN